jgi:hypothetical protein
MTKKQKPDEKGLTYYELGEALHTALRKCCDSKPTSLLYNVVSLCNNPDNDKNGWHGYLRHAFPLLATATTHEQGIAALKQAAILLDRKGPWSSESNALVLSMSLLDDTDWSGMLAYGDEFTAQKPKVKK